MRVSSAACAALLAFAVATGACARNSESNETGAATGDTTGAAVADSAVGNQTESGVVDSSGQSTLGPEVEKTRPDQGEPVTSKGDTINTAVDSGYAPQ